ncbi:MAG: ATP-binding protein, partial [Oscillospiraceae bacterium]|nr:ATP-binding protein [Oscillospiraceae bacterium]
PEIFRKLEREHFRRSNEQSDETEQALLDCDLLILDDLGTEFFTSFIASTLYHILNARLNAQKPIIVNTNLGIKELEGRYDHRVTSRIIGSFEPKRFVGGDVRQIKKFGLTGDANA